MSKIQEAIFENKHPEILENFGLDPIEIRRLSDYFARVGRYAIKGFDLGIATLQLLDEQLTPRLLPNGKVKPFLFSTEPNDPALNGYRLALAKGANHYNATTPETTYMQAHTLDVTVWARHNSNGNILTAHIITDYECEHAGIQAPFNVPLAQYVALYVQRD